MRQRSPTAGAQQEARDGRQQQENGAALLEAKCRASAPVQKLALKSAMRQYVTCNCVSSYRLKM